MTSGTSSRSVELVMAGAGRRLAVDQTTVARRLRAIEAVLGCRLFERVDGAMLPTRVGEAMIARAAEIEAHIDDLKDGVADGDPHRQAWFA